MSKPAAHNSQLLSLDPDSARCLLEAYVKRSLSLNEECWKNQLKQRKMVKKSEDRASSDTTGHRLSVEGLLTKCPKCAPSAFDLQSREKSKRKVKRSKTTKSFFKGFLNFFSKKCEPPVNNATASEQPAIELPVECCLETSINRRRSSRKSYLLNDQRAERNETATFSFGHKEPSDVSADSSNKYYQRMSMELESIVNEIQFPPEDSSASLSSPACLGSSSPDESDDTVERIISLLKQQGDIIETKISRNKSVQDFLQKLTYTSFQQLADRYVAQIPSSSPQTTDASPEVVRLAVTLDFTAKVARLCIQTVGLIMGFGHQYLQDSFTQMCVAHTQEPEDSDEQNTCDLD